MENFFINYLSSQSQELYPDNTNQKFRVLLPQGFLPRRLNEQKLLVGLKFISFSANPEVVSVPRNFALKSSLVLTGDRSDGNQLKVFYHFYLSDLQEAQQYQQYIERPRFFVTTRENLIAVEFEFLEYNTSRGCFESVKHDFFKSFIPVHLQVEVKGLSQDMALEHINLLVSSADRHSRSLHPSNYAYDFTFEGPQIRLADHEQWVMGLKSATLPSLVKNAYDPAQCWVRYRLQFSPKPGNYPAYLPYTESYEGGLGRDHYANPLELLDDLGQLLEKVSLVRGGVRVMQLGGRAALVTMEGHELYHKAKLLKRPNPDSAGLFEQQQPLPRGRKKIRPGPPKRSESTKKRGREGEGLKRTESTKREREGEPDGAARPSSPKRTLTQEKVDLAVDDNQRVRRSTTHESDEEHVDEGDEGDESDGWSDDTEIGPEAEPEAAVVLDTTEEALDEVEDGDEDKEDEDEDEEVGENKRLRLDERRLLDEDDMMMHDAALARDLLEADRARVFIGPPVPSRDEFPTPWIDEAVADGRLASDQVLHQRALSYCATYCPHDLYLYFELSPLFAQLLGIPEDKRKVEKSGLAFFLVHERYKVFPDFSVPFARFGSPDTILVNCDVVEDSVVGQLQLPVLRHLYLGEKKNERDTLQHWTFHIDHFQNITARHHPFRFRLYLTDLQGVPIKLQEDQLNQPGCDTQLWIIMKRVA